MVGRLLAFGGALHIYWGDSVYSKPSFSTVTGRGAHPRSPSFLPKSWKWKITLNERKRSYWRYTHFPLPWLWEEVYHFTKLWMTMISPSFCRWLGRSSTTIWDSDWPGIVSARNVAASKKTWQAGGTEKIHVLLLGFMGFLGVNLVGVNLVEVNLVEWICHFLP